jgi:adenylate kinase family enzyme
MINDPDTFLTMRRVVIVGVTGAGKTTFARQLASRLGCPHVEMDALHWLTDWRETPLDTFHTQISVALDSSCWVIDGNYNKVRDIVWTRADTLVWLDYPLALILWRLTRRTLYRVLSQEALWNGNRERLWEHFSRKSLFLWALRTHRRYRRE